MLKLSSLFNFMDINELILLAMLPHIYHIFYEFNITYSPNEIISGLKEEKSISMFLISHIIILGYIYNLFYSFLFVFNIIIKMTNFKLNFMLEGLVIIPMLLYVILKIRRTKNKLALKIFKILISIVLLFNLSIIFYLENWT